MNLLIDKLPDTVNVGDAVYPIRTDFRISVMFELLMQDEELSSIEKLEQAVRLYYPHIPMDIPEAVKSMLWFYRCGEEDKQSVEKEKSADEEDAEEDVEEDPALQRIYSFEHDADYIFAAFMQQYGIDLTIVDLHWWKFRALFKSLNDNCEFVKIMGYRSVKTTSKMSKEQRAFYTKMKSLHALPLPKTEQEQLDKITYALMHGGDLRGLV